MSLGQASRDRESPEWAQQVPSVRAWLSLSPKSRGQGWPWAKGRQETLGPNGTQSPTSAGAAPGQQLQVPWVLFSPAAPTEPRSLPHPTRPSHPSKTPSREPHRQRKGCRLLSASAEAFQRDEGGAYVRRWGPAPLARTPPGVLPGGPARSGGCSRAALQPSPLHSSWPRLWGPHVSMFPFHICAPQSQQPCHPNATTCCCCRSSPACLQSGGDPVLAPHAPPTIPSAPHLQEDSESSGNMDSEEYLYRPDPSLL